MEYLLCLDSNPDDVKLKMEDSPPETPEVSTMYYWRNEHRETSPYKLLVVAVTIF